MIVLVALVLLAMFILIWSMREHFAAVVDPEQYVNSTLVANY